MIKQIKFAEPVKPVITIDESMLPRDRMPPAPPQPAPIIGPIVAFRSDSNLRVYVLVRREGAAAGHVVYGFATIDTMWSLSNSGRIGLGGDLIFGHPHFLEAIAAALLDKRIVYSFDTKEDFAKWLLEEEEEIK